MASTPGRSCPAHIASPPHYRRHAGARPTAGRRTAALAALGKAVLPDSDGASRRSPPRGHRGWTVDRADFVEVGPPTARPADPAPRIARSSGQPPPNPPLFPLMTAEWQPSKLGGTKGAKRSWRRHNRGPALAQHASRVCRAPQAPPPHGHSFRRRRERCRGGYDPPLLSVDFNMSVHSGSAGPSNPLCVSFRMQIVDAAVNPLFPPPLSRCTLPNTCSRLYLICPLPSLIPWWSSHIRLSTLTLPAALQETTPPTSLRPARTTRTPRSMTSTQLQHPFPHAPTTLPE